MDSKLNNKGFSLIELLIALAVSAVVMTTILALLTYSSDRMAETQQRVMLQDEAKDIVNHVTNVVQEASETNFVDGTSCDYLLVKNDSEDAPTNRKEVVYWHIGNCIYFASTDEVSVGALTADKTHLLGEYVSSFQCDVIENDTNEKKYVTMNLNMQSEKASMKCSDNVYLRNQ